jgi:hypothetical protein
VRKAGRSCENGIDRCQGGIEEIEIQDISGRERSNAVKVFRAKIDHSFPSGEKEGISVGAADYRAGAIEKTAPVFEKGAGVRGSCASQFPDARDLFRGEITKRHDQGSGFHRKDGDMPAAVVAPLPAGQTIPIFRGDPAAQIIDPRPKIPVVREGYTAIFHLSLFSFFCILLFHSGRIHKLIFFAFTFTLEDIMI